MTKGTRPSDPGSASNCFSRAYSALAPAGALRHQRRIRGPPQIGRGAETSERAPRVC